MADPIYFNCGEFRPGQEPIYVSGIKPPVSPVLIPEPTEVRFPRLPRSPQPIPGKPRSPGGPGFPNIPSLGGGNQPPGGGGGASGTTGPSTGGSGNPSTGGPSGGNPGSRGPSTGVAEKWKCIEIKYYCPEDLGLEESQRRVVKIKRFCVKCIPLLEPETGQYVMPPECIYDSKSQCEGGCQDSNGLSNCLEENQIQVINQTQVFNPNLNNQISTNSQTGTINQPNNPVIQINIEAITTSNQNVTVSTTGGGPTLYDPLLNIFQYHPNTEINLTNNNQYPGVFGTMVTIEVAYLLNLHNSLASWSEVPIQNLTLENLAASLNTNLLNAFNSIHNQGGTLVGSQYFLEGLKKHLITGTMEEFDPNFFIELAFRQRQDKVIQYTGSIVPEINERAALGEIAYNAVLVDTSKYNSLYQRQLRRQRRLNEDIGAIIPLCREDDQLAIPIDNDGLCFTPFNSVSLPMPNGHGDGYYLNLESDICIPLYTTNSVSSSYYIPADVRENALSLFGEDSGVMIRAESTINEFTIEGDTLGDVSQLRPLYFSLILSSVSSILTANPLIDRSIARYELLTETSSIDTHVNDNGFAISRLNIDFRDPILTYILSTSSLNLEQNDITFRAFDENKGIVNQSVLCRNIPFGLVLTPVVGSKFNPFNGYSKIEQFEDSAVRSLRFVPSIDYSQKDRFQSHLDEINLFDASGLMKIGFAEPNDLQNLTYKFDPSSLLLTNTYFSGGAYISSIPESSSYGIQSLINTIDQIITDYDPEEITWFEVFRRMTLNKFGHYLYDGSQALHQKLSKGFRDNLKIKDVLNRLDNNNLLLEDDSNVIIKKQDRNYAKSY